ncbi:MAG: hypothetical protein ACT6U0_20540, partial [Shinella sp.]
DIRRSVRSLSTRLAPAPNVLLNRGWNKKSHFLQWISAFLSPFVGFSFRQAVRSRQAQIDKGGSSRSMSLFAVVCCKTGSRQLYACAGGLTSEGEMRSVTRIRRPTAQTSTFENVQKTENPIRYLL